MSSWIYFKNIKLLIIILLIILIIIKYNSIKYNNKTYYQCNKSNDMFVYVLEKNNIKQTNNKKYWSIILPCNEKYTELSYMNTKPTNKHQIISTISQNNVLGSKVLIWISLINKYGRQISSTIMPNSFIFPKDVNIFNKSYSKHKMYMMKSEQQRQLGLKLSNNYNEIINSQTNGFKIVQEYINNPLTFNDYKINFRIYLLIVCNGNKTKKGYIYEDGIISYSKGKHSESNITFDSGVASFYTSKDLYNIGYPITFNELKIKMKNINWNNIMSNFINQITMVLNASSNQLCMRTQPYNNKSFQIFGIDYLVTNNLNTFILEINTGPGMTPFCNRDKQMRIKLYDDMLSIVGIIPKQNTNNFMKIWNN